MGPDYSVIIISEIIFHLDWATENVTQVGPLKIQSQLFWKFLQQKCRKFCILSLKMWQKRIYTHHEFPFLACAKKLSCGLKRKCWLGKMLYRKRAYIKNSFGKVNTIQWYDRFGNWRRKKVDKKMTIYLQMMFNQKPKSWNFYDLQRQQYHLTISQPTSFRIGFLSKKEIRRIGGILFG